jgi:hypothetical protein
VPTAISGLAAGLPSVPSTISSAVSSSPVSAASFGSATSALQGADFGSFTKDISGKITGLSGELQAKLPGAAAELQNKLPGAVAEFNKVLPQAQDQLKTVLNSPAINKFPITDMVKQVNTGFSVGALDSIDTTALNAAVVKQAGSLNNPQFIDSVTKSIGKFGVNVDQLKKQGFVRPEAVFNDQLAQSNSEAALKHLEMFSKQAQLSPEQQKQLNESILQIYAGVDKANPAE